MKHMKKANQLTKRIMSLLLAIALLIVGIRPITVHAAVTNMAVETINFRSFSNWRSGDYSCTTGRYSASQTRICLNDYVTVAGGKYKVCVKDSGYRLLIRELDKNKVFIKSYNLGNGSSYTPSTNAAYLGISIYKISGASSINYDTFKTLFANGFYAGLEAIKSEETSPTTPSDSNETEDSNTENNGTESDIVDNGSTVIENKVYDVAKIDYKDFSNWKTGMYHNTTGKYCVYPTRICLNDYVTVSGGEYKVYVQDAGYRLLIRELDKNKIFIKSYILGTGRSYTPSTNAAYLGISIYKISGESSINYDTFKTLFANGFYAGLEAIKSEETSPTTPSDSNETEDSNTENNGTESDIVDNGSTVIENKVYDAAKIDYKDFSNWKTGMYHNTTGKYCVYPTRICLNDYVTVSGGEYKVCVKDAGYHLLIRELNSNKAFIKSYNLANGQSYTPSVNAAYLGISIYKLSGESSVSYDTFKTLFANGFYAGLEVVEEEEVEEEEKELDNGSSSGDTMENSNSQAVYDLLKKAMLQSDKSIFNISKYKLSVDEVKNVIWRKVINDNYLEYVAQCGVQVWVTDKNGYAYQCYLVNIDGDYENRLSKVKASVNKYLEQVDSRMTDVEKVLLAHEFVVNSTEYKAANRASYWAAGPLTDGYGVCAGYSGAMIALLHCVGIEAYEVVGQGMNHEWIYVKLDGEYYHIDPTWDDTRKGTDAVYQHRFLLRNDDEFSTISSGEVHRNWYSYQIDNVSCSSQRFTNWYVHDVAGTMHYYNGMWYYKDVKTNSIKCANISGSVQRVVIDGTTVSGTVKIKGIENGVLSYYVGSNLCTQKF